MDSYNGRIKVRYPWSHMLRVMDRNTGCEALLSKISLGVPANDNEWQWRLVSSFGTNNSHCANKGYRILAFIKNSSRLISPTFSRTLRSYRLMITELPRQAGMILLMKLARYNHRFHLHPNIRMNHQGNGTYSQIIVPLVVVFRNTK